MLVAKGCNLLGRIAFFGDTAEGAERGGENVPEGRETLNWGPTFETDSSVWRRGSLLDSH